jgi:hypothetical protein
MDGSADIDTCSAKLDDTSKGKKLVWELRENVLKECTSLLQALSSLVQHCVTGICLVYVFVMWDMMVGKGTKLAYAESCGTDYQDMLISIHVRYT